VRAAAEGQGLDAGWPEDWAPNWPFEHTFVVTRGNHFTMVEEHAAHTAGLVRDWMRSTFG
jgi:polyketide synthase 7